MADEKTVDNNQSKVDEVKDETEQVDMKTSFKRKLAKKDDEIEQLKSDLEHWKNEYYKAYADMANLRKDIQKDHEEVLKYRVEGFVDNLLGVLDSFDMAFKNEPNSPEMKNYLLGFKYVYNQLLEVLKNEGIEIIEPKTGDKFDESKMHAVEKEFDDTLPEGSVKQLNLKGYKLHNHIIRAAMVVTSSKVKTEVEVNNEKENVA
ncbi:MAG: nucleotide exchange factor GrpE [Erysipelotrichaceae bacterium]|nr:nucleotide exchange factor GrpE [Erysipelotrichaceae bacterium]